MRREEGVEPMIKEAQERFKKDKEWVRSGILQEIFEERNSQVSKNLREDYNLTEWLALIGLYCSQAFINYDRNARNSSKRSLIKAAALILAAVENFYYDSYKLSSNAPELKLSIYDSGFGRNLQQDFYLGDTFFHFDKNASVWASRFDHRVIKGIIDNSSNKNNPTSVMMDFLNTLGEYVSEKIDDYDVVLEVYDDVLQATVLKVMEFRTCAALDYDEKGQYLKPAFSLRLVEFNADGSRSKLTHNPINNPMFFNCSIEEKENIKKHVIDSFGKFIVNTIITNYKFKQTLAYRLRVAHL